MDFNLAVLAFAIDSKSLSSSVKNSFQIDNNSFLYRLAKNNVLEMYPNAFEYKHPQGDYYSIFSDSDIINAKRLSKQPFEGKKATTPAEAWRQAAEKIERS